MLLFEILSVYLGTSGSLRFLIPANFFLTPFYFSPFHLILINPVNEKKKKRLGLNENRQETLCSLMCILSLQV